MARFFQWFSTGFSTPITNLYRPFSTEFRRKWYGEDRALKYVEFMILHIRLQSFTETGPNGGTPFPAKIPVPSICPDLVPRNLPFKAIPRCASCGRPQKSVRNETNWQSGSFNFRWFHCLGNLAWASSVREELSENSHNLSDDLILLINIATCLTKLAFHNWWPWFYAYPAVRVNLLSPEGIPRPRSQQNSIQNLLNKGYHRWDRLQ